jgi:ubiquinone biosynthesis O-methyltransferase
MLGAIKQHWALMQSKEPPRAVPSLAPETYVTWRASDLGTITERIERQLIIELVGDIRGKRVLDVGCGDGALAIELRKSGAAVTGIDVSDAMITAARERARAHGADCRFSVAAAEALPFAAGHFDVVVAVTILCFVDDQEPVFREMARVLRPGGRLVIGELGKWSPWAAGRRVRAWLGSQLWRRGKFRTAHELAARAIGAGLSVEAVRGAIFFPRLRLAARLLAPFDASLGRLTTIGAAFVALSATKPI